MAARNPHRPFTPNPEMMALRPGVKGNEINGLGEAEVRRPSASAVEAVGSRAEQGAKV